MTNYSKNENVNVNVKILFSAFSWLILTYTAFIVHSVTVTAHCMSGYNSWTIFRNADFLIQLKYC
jgi:hypothetical protein